jgi:hypothetical protein
VEKKNLHIRSSQNSLLGDSIQGSGRKKRRYTLATEVEKMAIDKYLKNGEGLTTRDLHIRKSQAQATLKHFVERQVLFTLDRRRPQRYYPSSLKAQIMDRHKSGNIPKWVTGSSCFSNPLEDALQPAKSQSMLDAIISAGDQPLYIHKLECKFVIDKQAFAYLEESLFKGGTPATVVTEIGKHRIARIAVYPNGTVMGFIGCTNRPFKIEAEEDIVQLFTFLGHVRMMVISALMDYHEDFVPPLSDWLLLACDLNRDVDVNNMLGLSSISIQLTYAERVFRAYIKETGQKTVCRVEESLTPKMPIYEFLKNITQPTQRLNDIYRKLEQIDNRLAKQDDVQAEVQISQALAQ